MTKRCNRCQTEKELSAFHVRESSPDGRRAICKQCRSEQGKMEVDKAREAKRKYVANNREKVRKMKADYHNRHRDVIQAKRKAYYLEHRERLLAKDKEYRKMPQVKERQSRRRKERKTTDPGYKAMCNLRRRIHAVITGNPKCDTSKKLLGCDKEFLMTHIERQFSDGMTWDNYGPNGWHIDHIVPCSSFDLSDPDQQRRCFHYTNLQPLWADDNRRKGNRLCVKYRD